MPDFEQLTYRQATAVTIDKIEANIATLQSSVSALQAALAALTDRVEVLEQA